MARTVCIKPCPPNLVLPQVRLPIMGPLKAQGNFSLQGGCNGCELVGNLLLQLNPMLGSLGLPLCVLGCVGAIVKFTKAVPDSLGPPPDPTALASALAGVILKCKCVVEIALPPPIGLICQFLKMVSDIVTLISQVVTCLVGLVTHLLSFNLKAAILLGSPDAAMKATGSCLIDQGQGMLDLLLAKLGSLGALLALLEPVFDLLAEVVPAPFNQTIIDLKSGFATFNAGSTQGAPPGTFLTTLQTFSTILQTVATAFATIVSVCP